MFVLLFGVQLDLVFCLYFKVTSSGLFVLGVCILAFIVFNTLWFGVCCYVIVILLV